MIKKSILCISFVLLVFVSSAFPQFFKVYGWKTRAQNEVELVLYNTVVVESDLTSSFFGKEVSKEGLWSHSIEAEYGVTDRLTVALYFDFEDPKGANVRHYRTRAVVFRYRFGEKGGFFMDPAIYVEYYIPRKSYKDYEELEIKLILERDFGHFRLDLNPMVEKKTSGSEVNEGLEFNYAIGFYYKKYRSVQPGIEFHGKMGEFSNFPTWDQQRHYIFPTVDLRFGPGFHWHLGAGVGLTGKSDDLLIKSIFSYSF